MSSQPPDRDALGQAIEASGFSLPLGMVLFILLMMAMQLAPMLTYFNNVLPTEAMKLSLRAFLYNLGPMVVYITTFTLLAWLASQPMMLGWLIVLPLVFTSLYACYRDIFAPGKAGAPAGGEPPKSGDITA